MRGGMRYATPPPRLLIIRSTGERDAGGGMRYAVPPPRLLIIHLAGERDPGRTRYATPPPPPFINYSLSGMRAAPLFFRLFTHLSEGMRVGMLQ